MDARADVSRAPRLCNGNSLNQTIMLFVNYYAFILPGDMATQSAQQSQAPDLTKDLAYNIESSRERRCGGYRIESQSKEPRPDHQKKSKPKSYYNGGCMKKAQARCVERKCEEDWRTIPGNKVYRHRRSCPPRE